MSVEETKRFYRRYLACLNAHDVDLLGELVAEDVVVNGSPRGLAGYQDGLRRVIAAFPDYHWQLQHLLAEDDWLAAHFTDSGTHRGEFLEVAATGTTVVAQEFAFYRLRLGKIAEVWGVADNLELLRQLNLND